MTIFHRIIVWIAALWNRVFTKHPQVLSRHGQELPQGPETATSPAPLPAKRKPRAHSVRKSIFNFLRSRLIWDAKDGTAVLGRNAAKRAARRPRPQAPKSQPPPMPVCLSLQSGNGFRHHAWGRPGKVRICRRCRVTQAAVGER